MSKVSKFTVTTARGTVRVSMRSTGRGAWVAAGHHNPRPLGVQIRPVQWISDADQIKNMIEEG